LAGRDDVLLEPILRLLLKYVADPRFGVMVADIAGVVIGEIPLSPDSSELILFAF
jgi:U3 small nucleolar RNA-associated protein 15